jgi:hypothetical protein
MSLIDPTQLSEFIPEPQPSYDECCEQLAWAYADFMVALNEGADLTDLDTLHYCSYHHFLLYFQTPLDH